MPYANEHAARLISPTGFVRFARENDEFGPGIDAIYGIRTDNQSTLQSIRFDKAKFTSQQARDWVSKHDHKVILFEPATDEQAASLHLAVWTRSFINDLPDSAFLYIESGGKKEGGKTTPRALRHFPYKDSGGKVDMAHLRNAVGRIPQSKVGLSSDRLRALQGKARHLLEAQHQQLAVLAEGDVFQMMGNEGENEHGQPVQRFRKELISVGKYHHPVHGWDLTVTPERMDRWVASFQKMQQTGVDIEVVVDHSRKVEAVRGYIKDIFREGNKLYGIHEMIGEDAVKLAQRVKNVSVLIDKNFKDGKGNAYGEAITHSSLVQQPIVPDQEGFIPIAASQDGQSDDYQIPLYYTLEQETKTMEKDMLELIRKLTGNAELVEEDALSKLEEHHTSLSTQVTELGQQLKELQNKKPEPKDKDKDKDKDEPASISPDMAEQMASTASQQLSLLVDKGKILPAVKDKLEEALVGPSGGRNLMTLSIMDQPDNTSVLSKVIDALQENDVVKLGEHTGHQVLELAHPGGDSKDDHDPEVTKEMVNEVNGPEE